MTGPFTLAGLMMGADDVVMATIDDPKGLHALCHFTTERIQEYVQLLIAAGADLVVILEPTAVMLSPEQFAEFSAVYVRHLTESFRYSRVGFVYHTCGNTMHLVGQDGPRGGARGQPRLARRRGRPGGRGTRDSSRGGGDRQHQPGHDHAVGHAAAHPSRGGGPAAEMAPFPNFVLSTGCDLPQETPPANIAAFMEAGRAWRGA